jgi:hypothetical protein
MFVWNSRLVLFWLVCTASLAGVTQDIRKRLFFGDWRETLVVFFGASVVILLEISMAAWFMYHGGGDLLIVMMVIGGLSCRRW